MDYTELWSQLLIGISALTAVVTIITEVAKNAFPALDTTEKKNIFVLCLSEILTVVSLFAYWQIKELPTEWYYVIAFFVVGLLVAYSAMFGYDKLISYFSSSKLGGE